MEKFLKKIFINLGIIAIFYCLAVVVATYFKTNEISFSTEYLTDTVTIFTTAILTGVFLLFKLFAMADGKGKKKKSKGLNDKGKDAKGKDVEQYFSGDFVSVDDLRTKKDFNFCTCCVNHNESYKL